MDNRTGRVLKADEVEVKGAYHLDISHSPKGPSNVGSARSTTPQVRIVENNADFAVMELTCACGTKTRVRCEYSESKTS